MKKLYSLTIAAGLALALAGCAGNNASTPSGDKDGDGVANISDQCPNTPAGTKVSKDGCKIYTSVLDLNVKEVCNVKANGLESVLAVAKKYNPTAVKHKVEFMRFGASTSAYIKGAEAAIKSGSAKANVKQKKKVVSMPTTYATWRACTFAVSALQQEAEAKSTWRLAVPGDGFKY